jgi:two-component system OmpR family sensor kinase
VITNSFRVQLSLWNVGVLAAVLGVVGVLLAFGIRNSTRAAVDRDLMLRAQQLERLDGPREPPPLVPPFAGPRGMEGRVGPGPRFPAEAPIGFGQPPPVPGVPGGPPPDRAPRPPRTDSDSEGEEWPSGEQAERAAWFMRPRMILRGNAEPFPPEGRTPWDPDTVEVAMRGQRVFSTIRVDGERLRVLSVPMTRRGEIVGVVQVARALGEFDRLEASQFRMLVTLLPLALLIAGLGALFLTERALRPVRDVTEAAARISAKDLSQRLAVKGHDELAQLASTFNGMIERLETAFEQQRRFTADASHELRTPLTRIKLTTSEALDGEHTPEEYVAALRIADRAAETMQQLVEQLLLLARADGGQLRINPEPVEVEPLLAEAAELFRQPGGPRVEVAAPVSDLRVNGDPVWLASIVRNLVENAVRHTPADGTVTLSAEQRNGRSCIRVSDTGEGIAPEHLPHLTERFYRADAARARSGQGSKGGTGLGLAIVRTLVEAQQGSLELESEPGRGTTATVWLPSAS